MDTANIATRNYNPKAFIETLESWCNWVFKRILEECHAQNAVLFVWQGGELKMPASQTRHGFVFYNDFLQPEDYNGFPYQLVEQAGETKQIVSWFSERPLNALWQPKQNNWLHLVIPLLNQEEISGFLLLDAQCQPAKSGLLDFDFGWLLDTADKKLEPLLLRHEISCMSRSRRESELDLVLSNRALTTHRVFLQSLHNISLRMATVDSVQSVCQVAIELGRKLLEFDRMAIFLCDIDEGKMYGTYGTDLDGLTIDTSDFVSDIPKHPMMNEALGSKNELIVKQNIPLYHNTDEVGIGWNSMVAMWQGDDCIGWIAADNLFKKRELLESQKDVMKYLAASVGLHIVNCREKEALLEENRQMGEQCRDLQVSVDEAHLKIEQMKERLATPLQGSECG